MAKKKKQRDAESVITRMVTEYLPDPFIPISLTAALHADIGCDSISLLELKMDIEEQYDVDLSGRISNDPTINELVAVVIAEFAI